MLIRYWMNKPVITVEKKDPMQRAIALMKENRIRLLPVTDGGRL
ncbi:MAG: CBS domain-containing protein, partial [Desulfosarcina sp.]|nr:CBS domain-containing protein [Desulfosarcina sp.]MBC2767983.1 CBS domain-containing protein [Desulfosarcina sp.]